MKRCLRCGGETGKYPDTDFCSSPCHWHWVEVDSTVRLNAMEKFTLESEGVLVENLRRIADDFTIGHMSDHDRKTVLDAAELIASFADQNKQTLGCRMTDTPQGNDMQACTSQQLTEGE